MSATLLTLLFALAPQQPVTTEVVATGLHTPVWVTHAPSDPATRIFVVTHWGKLRIVENDVLNPTAFLDIHHLVTFDNNEQGLLSAIFHPDYQQNGLFYVIYVDVSGNWVLERYQRDPLNPDLADPNSGVILLTIVHPLTWHHGGWMEFGQDGLLYIATGDGGGVGDPFNYGQDPNSLNGKLLRIDVDGGFPYVIPPGNPFVSDPNTLDEIWALGLRNPWRGDMDDLTGDIWFGDVGQDTWEELDFLPAGTAGANFGWRIMEGFHCYNPPSGCNMAGLVQPIHEYRHATTAQGYRCSISGGRVYRGRSMATMHGRFFFGDYCTGEVWSTRTDGLTTVDFFDHTQELELSMGTDAQVVGFGQDSEGELYICNMRDGSVHRVVPAGLRLRAPTLVSGSSTTLEVSGGSSSAAAGLFLSTRGLGSTPIPPANLVLDLDRPRVAASGSTDPLGRASFSATIPPSAAGRTVWLQAAQNGVVSNVVIETVD
ncbi:MAG: PQQ-dependent sugar dehydrogenase [Planctomycetota bacterium]|nr:PQQ-dependent sugar dehydrogenase [Planctomycetota bacterium]